MSTLSGHSTVVVFMMRMLARVRTHLKLLYAPTLLFSIVILTCCARQDRKLVRKIDFWLIPWLCLLYLLSFLDRTNIGNARLAGLEADLGMSGHDYNNTLTIFFVSTSFSFGVRFIHYLISSLPWGMVSSISHRKSD